MTLRSTALAWAKADRAADDREAELDRIEREIVTATDKTAPCGSPDLSLLLADRDGAVIAFRRACQLEHEANEAMRAAAHELLDQTERE